MKCDELKRFDIVGKYRDEETMYEFRPDGVCYDADDVDSAIAELKEFAEDACLERDDNQTAIDELQAENAELKKKLMPCLNGDCILTCEVVEKYGKENAELKQKLEDVKASHYAESVDAGMRERRLKRALWLTRAFRARDIQRWWLAVTCSKTTERACRVWNNVERKCRAKAEQYK